MDHREVGRYWEENAENWTRLARAGYDVYRDHLNTPGFFAVLPEVAGLSGLDVGCGEGNNTRLLAEAGAKMTAVDIAPTFIEHARRTEEARPLGIDYQVASAVELPFEDASFDFVASFMCLMDLPETDQAISEAFRVLRPGGFLQFSIIHPCFATPHRRNVKNPDGTTRGIEVGRYFESNPGEIEEWIFSSAPPELRAGLRRFRVPLFHRPLSDWINLLIAAGFVIEHLAEPRPTPETISQMSALQDASVVAYFLIVRGRKPYTFEGGAA